MGRLTPEQQALVETMIPVARFVARRFADFYGLDRDELDGVAFEELVIQAPRYDPGRAGPKTFFGQKVDFALRDWVRRDRDRNLTRRAVDLEIGYHPPYPEDVSMCEVRDEVENALSYCSSRTRAVLGMDFLDGLSDRAICGRLGLRKSRVSEIRRAALEFFRDHSLNRDLDAR